MKRGISIFTLATMSLFLLFLVYDANTVYANSKASWYGPGFHGKLMANGKIYDMNRLTAAHKTLPLGTKIKVTNLENNKIINVEITDRGPYVNGRILDLSKKAAENLGFIHNGITRVKFEILP